MTGRELLSITDFHTEINGVAAGLVYLWSRYIHPRVTFVDRESNAMKDDVGRALQHIQDGVGGLVALSIGPRSALRRRRVPACACR